MKWAVRTLAAVVLLNSAAAEEQYLISTVAGGPPAVTNIAQPARDLAVGFTLAVTTDAKGNVYFISGDLNSVFKLNANGAVTRVAGNTIGGYAGDGGQATAAELSLLGVVGIASPGGLAVDSAGNLFIADTGNNRVRRVSPSGIITTIAG